MIARLVGDDVTVRCLDGTERVYLGLDAGASTPAFERVATAVTEFLPNYSSVHRGAGAKSQFSTHAYEDAREKTLRFAGRSGGSDIAVLCRNTTEAINIAAHRFPLTAGDTIVTTVVEHHANLLPWQRAAERAGATIRYVECGIDGTFSPADVAAAIDSAQRPVLLAITGAANVTGWMPDLDPIIEHAHARGVRVLVDAAQLAPHRPMHTLRADLIAWSGHKMYAPFGTGVLIGPKDIFAEGAPFIVGGGAVNLVDLDGAMWTDAPDREEAGSPNVIGAVALAAAYDTFDEIGWQTIVDHEVALARKIRHGLAAIDGVTVLGPTVGDEAIDARMLAVGTFTVANMAHPLVAARLSHEYAIGVRHGCFCAHPYLVRLLGLSASDTSRYRHDITVGDRRDIPGAVRASAAISATDADIDRLLNALAELAAGKPEPVPYRQDPSTGDFLPEG
ncbi:MAG: aminotransferase class V-fold PLP-dependent enzyme [Actinobacteria bacterium]|nr:aminotransferase class V-fold PLP-dependent enzyme [Actinomycetota bacterium]